MPIGTTDNSYELKLLQAGLYEPLSTYLSDPRDVDRLAAGFTAFSSDGVSLVGQNGMVDLLSVPSTVVIFGHSIVEENYLVTATATRKVARWWTYAEGFLGQRLTLVNNAGVSGQTIAQMEARIDNSTLGAGFGAAQPVTTAPGVTPFRPGWVLFMGTINDLLAGRTSTAIIADLTRICDKLRVRGIHVGLMSTLPVRMSQSGMTTTVLGHQKAVDEWMKWYALNNRGVCYIPAAEYALALDSSDSQAQSPAAYYRDAQLHPNNVMSKAVGLAVYDTLNALIPKVDVLPTSNIDSTTNSNIPQLNPNPLMTGSVAVSGTGFSGNGPNTTGISYTRTAGVPTIVCSVGTRTDGFGQDLIMDITFTAASEGLEVRFPSQHTQLVAGNIYSTVCEVTTQGAAGANLAYADNMVTPDMYMQFNDGTTNHLRDSIVYTATDAALKDSHTMVQKTPDFLALPATTYTVARPVFSISSKGAGTVRVRLGRVGFMKKITA